MLGDRRERSIRRPIRCERHRERLDVGGLIRNARGRSVGLESGDQLLIRRLAVSIPSIIEKLRNEHRRCCTQHHHGCDAADE